MLITMSMPLSFYINSIENEYRGFELKLQTDSNNWNYYSVYAVNEKGHKIYGSHFLGLTLSNHWQENIHKQINDIKLKIDAYYEQK